MARDRCGGGKCFHGKSKAKGGEKIRCTWNPAYLFFIPYSEGLGSIWRSIWKAVNAFTTVPEKDEKK